jgi:predicted DNA-binding transcriptional regulator AlpA
MDTQTTNQTSQLLTAKALAKTLSLSARTVWRLRSAGKLPRPVEVGGSIRWLRQDIDKWIALGCPPQREFEATAD